MTSATPRKRTRLSFEPTRERLATTPSENFRLLEEQRWEKYSRILKKFGITRDEHKRKHPVHVPANTSRSMLTIRGKLLNLGLSTNDIPRIGRWDFLYILFTSHQRKSFIRLRHSSDK